MLQRATGVTREAARLAPLISAAVAPQAFEFIGRQQLAIVATLTEAGLPWCSAVVGDPGVFAVVDPTIVRLDLRRGIIGDDTGRNAVADAPIGLLFIDLVTRRRYRVNGTVIDASDGRIDVRVVDAYPNCPKYIHRRDLRLTEPGVTGDSLRAGERLGANERRLIRAADTFFVASTGPDHKLDASHRGGPAGFVRVDGNQLRIPDYAGNNMYNTLGNLVVRPAGSLLFIDFRSGDTLQLAGLATIDLAADDPEADDTHRAWTFTVTAWQRSSLAAHLRIEGVEQRNGGEPNPRP